MGLFLYISIFTAKVVEVTFGTLRTIYVAKGERVKAAFFGLIEIIIWLQVASTVVNGLHDDPLKGVAYAIGFAVGVYLGILVSERMSNGSINVTVIIEESDENNLINKLREDNIPVTVIKGEGKDSLKSILIIMMKSKEKEDILNKIKVIEPNAVITTSDTNPFNKAYGILK